MNSPNKKQGKVLRYSILFSVIFTLLALIMGFLTSSQVILIDGVYTLISVVLTYFSIVTVKFINKKDVKNYPFGKEALEPFIVLSQYGILIIFSITSIVNAVLVILDGGKDVDIASGVFYAVFSSILCYASYLYLKRLARRSMTSVEEIEIEQWKYSYLFSLAMLVGFAVAWMLVMTPLSSYIRYVDPVLAILITLGFIKTSVTGIRNCVRELLSAAPPSELRDLITKKVKQINANYDFSDIILRLAKVGRQLIIEIDYIIEEGSHMDSIRIQDKLREQLDLSFRDIPFDKWLNVNFVGDKKWAE